MDIVTKHPDIFSSRKHFETLAILRHHGAPNRLLDVSWNPLVSLYMAVSSDEHYDGAVFVIPIDKNKKKYATSDTILALSSLSFLSNEDKEELKKVCHSLGKEETLDEYQFKNKKCVHHLYHEIRGEYPAYECEIKVGDLLNYFFALPPQNDKRMIAQKGFFVIFGLDIEKKAKELTDESTKIIISRKSKQNIKRELEICGIDEAFVYPDIDKDIEYEKKTQQQKQNYFDWELLFK